MEQVAFTWRWLEKWENGFPGDSAFKPGLKDTVQIGTRQELICFHSAAMRVMSLFKRDQGGAFLLLDYRAMENPGSQFAQQCEALFDAYHQRSLMPLPSGPEFERVIRMIGGILGANLTQVGGASTAPAELPPFQVSTVETQWRALESYDSTGRLVKPSDLDAVRRRIRTYYDGQRTFHAGRACTPAAWLPLVRNGDPLAFVHLQYADCSGCILAFSRERQPDWDLVAQYTSDYYLERYPNRIKRYLAEEIRLDDSQK